MPAPARGGGMTSRSDGSQFGERAVEILMPTGPALFYEADAMREPS